MNMNWKNAYSTECSDGFGVKILVSRPADIAEMVENLSDTNPKGDCSLTPKEISNTMFTSIGGKIFDMLYVQAAKLNPETERQKAATREEFLKAFKDAGFDTIFIEETPNEYHTIKSANAISDPWYIVTTTIGHIRVGWRKRVVMLMWSRSAVGDAHGESMFPDEQVTQGINYIHAWSYEKLVEYLKTLKTWSEKQEGSLK